MPCLYTPKTARGLVSRIQENRSRLFYKKVAPSLSFQRKAGPVLDTGPESRGLRAKISMQTGDEADLVKSAVSLR